MYFFLNRSHSIFHCEWPFLWIRRSALTDFVKSGLRDIWEVQANLWCRKFGALYFPLVSNDRRLDPKNGFLCKSFISFRHVLARRLRWFAIVPFHLLSLMTLTYGDKICLLLCWEIGCRFCILSQDSLPIVPMMFAIDWLSSYSLDWHFYTVFIDFNLFIRSLADTW